MFISYRRLLIHNLSAGASLIGIYLLGVGSYGSHWEVQRLQIHVCYLILINTRQFAEEHGQGQQWVFMGEVRALLTSRLAIINGLSLMKLRLRVTHGVEMRSVFCFFALT